MKKNELFWEKNSHEIILDIVKDKEIAQDLHSKSINHDFSSLPNQNEVHSIILNNNQSKVSGSMESGHEKGISAELDSKIKERQNEQITQKISDIFFLHTNTAGQEAENNASNNILQAAPNSNKKIPNNPGKPCYTTVKLFPYDLVQTQDVHVEKIINDHGTLTYCGILPEEVRDMYMKSAQFGTTVTLMAIDGEDVKTIFCGVLTDLQVKKEGELYKLFVQAKTFSYFMDIQIASNSFQNIDMTYSELVEKVTSDYAGANTAYMILDNPCLDFFTLQYKETDWQFLKRMASHFHEALYPTFAYPNLNYYFGRPNINSNIELDDSVFLVEKDLAAYQRMERNDSTEVSEFDFITYRVKSFECIELGSQVHFMSMDFYIRRVEIDMENSMLTNTYTITTKKGMQCRYFENEKIPGVSIEGYVLDRKRDTIKVHMNEIDEQQDISTAYWFPYQAMYASDDGSGFYCMPELNDTVRIMLPNSNEKHAYAVSSVSNYQGDGGEGGGKGGGSGDRMGNPDIRWLRNPQGMEVRLYPDRIEISANAEATITLMDTGEIYVYGKNEVGIRSENLISIHAMNDLLVHAKNDITIESDQGGKITMDTAGVTNILGEEVYTN